MCISLSFQQACEHLYCEHLSREYSSYEHLSITQCSHIRFQSISRSCNGQTIPTDMHAFQFVTQIETIHPLVIHPLSDMTTVLVSCYFFMHVTNTMNHGQATIVDILFLFWFVYSALCRYGTVTEMHVVASLAL